MGVGKRIRINGKLSYEHKEIMQKYLGREVASDEVIHHIDGDPFNNDINNLELLTRGQHTTCHFKGINNPSAKLTEDGIRQIRSLKLQGYGCRRIAKLFGIAMSTAAAILRRENWSHV